MVAIIGGEYQQTHNATSCSDNPRVLWFGIGAVYIIPLTKARNARSANSKCQIQVLA